MDEKNIIEQIVRNYFTYLYDANTDSIIDLYSENAILMPADLPTAKGKADLMKAYNQTFDTIKFVSATTNYDEVSIFGDVAIVRTTSETHLFLKNENQEIKSKMREFFILIQEENEWKISRYMFNLES
jgi:ketosteroid isomerase-like protein